MSTPQWARGIFKGRYSSCLGRLRKKKICRETHHQDKRNPFQSLPCSSTEDKARHRYASGAFTSFNDSDENGKSHPVLVCGPPMAGPGDSLINEEKRGQWLIRGGGARLQGKYRRKGSTVASRTRELPWSKVLKWLQHGKRWSPSAHGVPKPGSKGR